MLNPLDLIPCYDAQQCRVDALTMDELRYLHRDTIAAGVVSTNRLERSQLGYLAEVIVQCLVNRCNRVNH